VKVIAEAVLATLVVLLILRVVHDRRSLEEFDNRFAALRDSVANETADHRLAQRLLAFTRLLPEATLSGEVGGTEAKMNLSALRRPVVIFMLNNNCAACLRALPFVQSLSENVACDIDVVALNTNPAAGVLDSPPRVDSLSYAVWTSFSGEVVRALPTDASPATVVIGLDGRIGGIWVGEHNDRVRTAVRDGINRQCPTNDMAIW